MMTAHVQMQVTTFHLALEISKQNWFYVCIVLTRYFRILLHQFFLIKNLIFVFLSHDDHFRSSFREDTIKQKWGHK